VQGTLRRAVSRLTWETSRGPASRPSVNDSMNACSRQPVPEKCSRS
jgi:hypothetical protein